MLIVIVIINQNTPAMYFPMLSRTIRSTNVKTLFHSNGVGTGCVVVLLVFFYINLKNSYPLTDGPTVFFVLVWCSFV